MKALIFISVFLFALPQGYPTFETRYDRFADETSVVLTENLGVPGVVDLGGGSIYVPPGVRGGTLYLHIAGMVKGIDPKKGIPRVLIMFTSTSRDWIYLKQTNTLRFILDGRERLDLGVMSRTSGDVLNGARGVRVVDQISLSVPFAVIEKLANVNKLEMQVSEDEFEFTQRQLADLKEWVSRFAPQTPTR